MWLKMMLCVMMLPLVVVGCTSKRSPWSVRGNTTASGVDMQPPRLADTAERDYFTRRERADHYAKTTGRAQKYINAAVIELPYVMGNSCNYCEQYTRDFEYKCLK